MNYLAELAAWGRSGLELIFPRVCPGCGEQREAGGIWCPDCRTVIFQPRVILPTVIALDSCRTLTRYEGPIRNLLRGLKFQGRRANAAPLAYWFDFAGPGALPPAADLAVPVPLAAQRSQERGFNQVDLLCRSFCEKRGVPWNGEALCRRRDTAPQWRLDRRQRRENTKDAFLVTRPENIRGKRIWLCDDIVTTGGTMAECAVALKLSGAAAVHGLALSFAPNPGR